MVVYYGSVPQNCDSRLSFPEDSERDEYLVAHCGECGTAHGFRVNET